MIIWVLIVTIAITGEPVQKVAVSGYHSDAACLAKGQEMLKVPIQPQTPQEAGKPYTISYECVRGVEA